jgi:hypothetical protein
VALAVPVEWVRPAYLLVIRVRLAVRPRLPIHQSVRTFKPMMATAGRAGESVATVPVPTGNA